MRKLFLIGACLPLIAIGQQPWKNVDGQFGPLPASVQVYFTDAPVDTAPFRAYYVKADLRVKSLGFATDTTWGRRLTPQQYFERNEKPLVVVNGTFFSFATNQNLNIVVKDGKLVSYNPRLKGRGLDSLSWFPSYRSALGITKKRSADVAWIYADSGMRVALASQTPVATRLNKTTESPSKFKKWKVVTAIGGGPVLVQNGKVHVTNDEEKLFAGKAAYDKHPRTAMGYTADGKLIILAIEGRNTNASGATLYQTAMLLQQLGCVEALNLDGGGSSCLLVNGKETIKPSDKEGQRPVPGVFLIEGR